MLTASLSSLDTRSTWTPKSLVSGLAASSTARNGFLTSEATLMTTSNLAASSSFGSRKR